MQANIHALGGIQTHDTISQVWNRSATHSTAMLDVFNK
jgi:hypothetical protein